MCIYCFFFQYKITTKSAINVIFVYIIVVSFYMTLPKLLSTRHYTPKLFGFAVRLDKTIHCQFYQETVIQTELSKKM